jgi:Mn2+/Fe2+ NRAMP family transporter
LKRKLPITLVLLICLALFAANTLNVAADLSAMADAAELLSGISSHIFVILFAAVISWATVRLRYHQIAGVLKWLAIFLFGYIVVALIAKPDWLSVFHDVFHPRMPKGSAEWSILVAILGTTISPYLFFWQSSQEVEEEIKIGRTTVEARVGATHEEITLRKIDVGVGTFFSNFVMFFIILAAALTLHKHGVLEIETTSQAAKALEPLAGHLSTLLYTIGIIATGFLAIPTLTGSAAYALAETFKWDGSLDAPLSKAHAFYSVILVSTILAVVFDFADFNPLKTLYYSAIVNGLVAPFVLLGVLLIAMDRKMMKGQPSSKLSAVVVGFTTLLMFIAAVAMFLV